MTRRRMPILVAIGVSGALAACGTSGREPARGPARAGSATALPAPCAARARDALARSAAISAATITATRFTAPSGAASCRFRTRRGTGVALDVVTGLDSAPQVTFRLERQVVEYGQNAIWSHRSRSLYPVRVAHLGLDADWLPAESELLTTDGVRLITVTIVGPSTRASDRRRIAVALARSYLGPLHAP